MTALIEDLFATGKPTRVMAVINASPESFYGDSVRQGADEIAAAAADAERSGAALIDIGAMSTAPYKDTWISPEEEIDRLCRGIEAIRGACSLPISADTQRAAVAAAALDCGALIVNDVSGFRSDPAMAPLVAERGAGAILMANDDPELDDQGRHPVSVVRQLLDEAVDRAILAGVPRGRLMVDPGFGFFRHRSIPWYEFDLRMLQGVPCYRELGLPLLLGVSRKSFFSKMLGEKDAADRLPGSLAVAAWSLIKGIDWLRVHDVRETVDTLRMMRLLTEQGDFSPEE